MNEDNNIVCRKGLSIRIEDQPIDKICIVKNQ